MQGGISASLSLRKRPLTGPSSGFPQCHVALPPQAGRGKPSAGRHPKTPAANDVCVRCSTDLDDGLREPVQALARAIAADEVIVADPGQHALMDIGEMDHDLHVLL